MYIYVSTLYIIVQNDELQSVTFDSYVFLICSFASFYIEKKNIEIKLLTLDSYINDISDFFFIDKSVVMVSY